MDDGGKAFPNCVEQVGNGIIKNISGGGMSLRDWFAGSYAAQCGRSYRSYADMAEEAYKMADALLVYRESHQDVAKVMIEELRETVETLGNENRRLYNLLEALREKTGHYDDQV